MKGKQAAKEAAPTSAPARAQAKARARDDAAPPPAPVDPETFAIYMAGVQALGDRANRIPTTASRVERAARAAPVGDPDAEARAKMRSLVIEGIRFETTDDGHRIEGRRLDVDPREVRRLRRGRDAVDGTLDLRGLRPDEARAAVEAFVPARQTAGDRVVTIVHGEGSRSPGGHGVLRGEIAAWLSQGRAARHVAAFATAPAEGFGAEGAVRRPGAPNVDPDGGAGAVLVLLAR